MPGVNSKAVPMHLDLITYFDGNGKGGNGSIDFSNRYKAKHNGNLNHIVAKARSQVEMPQAVKVIHFQYSKSQFEERADYCKRLGSTYGQKFPIANYFPKDQPMGNTGSGNNNRYMLRAPATNEKDFTLKRGQPVFEIVDPILQESRRTVSIGASSLYCSNIYNGLPHFMEVRFVGISQTESRAWDNTRVMQACVAATDGTAKILNSSTLYLPLNSYCFQSNFSCIRINDDGTPVPVIITDIGDGGAGISNTAFLPSIFYLQDNSLYSMEQRIDTMLTSMFAQEDDTFDSKALFSDRLSQYVKRIADICDRRSTTFELRKDFVLYEFATVMAFILVLFRVDCFKHDNRADYLTNLADVVALGARVLSFYGRERAEIVANQMGGFFPNVGKLTQVLTSDYLWTAPRLAEELVKIKELADPDVHGGDTDTIEHNITDLLNQRWWVWRRLNTSCNQLRAEGHKIMKRMYMGINREAAEPGEWFTIEINA